MSEKEQEMTSKKLGLHVGDSFQDTREIREVLDKSVFREEEPTMSASRHIVPWKKSQISQLLTLFSVFPHLLQHRCEQLHNFLD